MYTLFLFASKIMPWLPDWLINSIAQIAGWITWLIATKAREQAISNILHVLGIHLLDTPQGRKKLHAIVRAMFYNNVLNYLTMFSLPSHKPEHILQEIHIEGREHLDAAFACGKGVILSSPHIGQFNYLLQWVVVSGYDLTLPVEHLKDERTLRLVSDLRSKHGVHVLPLQGNAAIRTIFHKLRANKAVLIAADRAVEGQSRTMAFFGAPAHLPVGVALLAQKTGATIVGASGWRTSAGKMHGRFFPLSLALTDEQRMDTDEVQRAVVALIEANISAHPDNWLAFTPIWTERPIRAPQAKAMKTL